MHYAPCIKFQSRKKEIVADYENGSSLKKLKEKFKLDTRTLSWHLKHCGVKVKSENGQYKNWGGINDSYFSSIDTEEKAWLLGLLAADGCVKRNKRGKPSGITIAQSGDRGKEIITYIKSILSINNSVVTVKTICQDSHSIGACSERVVGDLAKYNIVSVKSLIYTFPEDLPKQYITAFIRGYFDGDGSIGEYANNKGCKTLHLSMAGTKAFLERCKELIPCPCSTFRAAGKDKKIWELRWTGRKAIKFGEWLFVSEVLYRYYKYDFFKQYSETFKVTPPRWKKYHQERERARELYLAGNEPTPIGVMLGLPFQTIYGWKKEGNWLRREEYVDGPVKDATI